MGSDDVSPDRISAAKEAAVQFVQQFPRYFRVGVVMFAATVDVDVAPSTDRALALDAIRHAEIVPGTAIGEAIYTSLDALTQDAGLAIRVAAHANRSTRSCGMPRSCCCPTARPTAGAPTVKRAMRPVAAGVPVSTIAFGTDHGVIDGAETVPVDNDSLRAIASRTGGSFFQAENRPELASVFDNLGFRLTYRTEHRPVTEWFVGAALALALATAALSLAWFARLP